METIETFLHWLVAVVEHLGYPGIFILSMLESTFLPIPSEVTLIPAGYLVHQGKMEGELVFILAVAGTLAGSLINYWLAYKLGRRMMLRFGKYFFLNEEHLNKVENYFKSHGPISVFTGRLIVGVRHFIAFPAGLGQMPLKPFIMYTVLGAAIWTLVLLVLGYEIGNNQERITHYLIRVKVGVLALVVAGAAFYIYRHRKKS